MRAPRLADIRRGDRYLAVNTTILASLALFASAFTADDAAGAISPSGFYIAEVTTDGPGCPAPGSVQVTLSADRTRIQILYDDMQLQREPGVAVQTTHCTAALSLHIPPGWRVAPANLRTRGHTILDQGMTARRATDLAFVGIAGGPGFTSDFKGPLNNVYQVEDLVTPGVASWSSCGGPATLAIRNGLTLDAAGAPPGGALFTLHDQRLVSWQFKKC